MPSFLFSLLLISVLSIGANVPIYFMLRTQRPSIHRLHVPAVVAPVTSYAFDEWRGMY